MADSRIQKFEGRLAAPRRRLNLVDEALESTPVPDAAGDTTAEEAPPRPKTKSPDPDPAPTPPVEDPADPRPEEDPADDVDEHDEGEAAPAAAGKTRTAGTGSSGSKRRTPSVKKQSTAVDSGARVTLKVDEDLRNALDRASRSRACTLADVVFDAIEQATAADRLGEILLEHTTEPPAAQARPDALFARTVSRRAKPKVTIELRMIASDRKILDHMVKQYKAESRTHLIIAALRAHLDVPA